MTDPNLTNARAQQEAYDALPDAVRKAVREAPIKISALAVRDQLAMTGEARTLMWIADNLKIFSARD